MQVKGRVENPDNVDVTITMTMPVARWRDVIEILNGRDVPAYNDASQFKYRIGDVIKKIDATILGSPPKEDE